MGNRHRGSADRRYRHWPGALSLSEIVLIGVSSQAVVLKKCEKEETSEEVEEASEEEASEVIMFPSPCAVNAGPTKAVPEPGPHSPI
jgi:hypothetical protein